MSGIARPTAGTALAIALLFLASPNALAGGRHDDDGDDYSRAAELHSRGRFDQAAELFVASYRAGHREEASAYNAACAYARAGNLDQAFAWLDVAEKAGFDLGEYLDGDRDLRALRGDPRFAALRERVYRGRPSPAQREGERLVQRYGDLRAAGEDRADAYDSIGRELLGAGRYREAARAFVSAATRDDNPATPLYNAACALALQGQNGAALDLLQKAVEEGFADASHIDRDDDLDGLRHEPRFQEIRALAVELDTPSFPSHNDRSFREWQEALPRIEAAARRHPQLGQAWANLGLAQLALDRPELAVPAYERAAELGYRRSTSLYNLACANARSGRRDQALDALDRAIEAGFDNWSLLRHDGDLDDLRGDRRFRRYLELARAHE